jgi:N-acetylneuraminic acid mutarotase
MPTLDIQKLTSTPTTYKPNALYLIGPTDSPNELQIALSSSDGNTIRHTVTKAEVQSLINASTSSASNEPIGTVIKLLSPNTPSGYLKCNGAAVSKTTYSNLYNVIGDQYTPSFIETGGRAWQSQWGFNQSTQNDITGWTSANGLASAVRDAASLVTKNYIYVLGGQGPTSVLNTIQRASFDNDGNLSSTWSNVGTLPVSMYGMGYVATKGRYYLVGGYSGTTTLSTIYSAPINADGTLGTFRTETALPSARVDAACFVIKNKLYVVGGTNGNNTNTVYQATINTDGTLSSWTTLSNFPINSSYGKSLVINNRIYIFGAFDGNNSNIYYATYDSNGNIGTWTYVSQMPGNVYGPIIASTDNYVFSISGYSRSTSSYTSSSYRVPISADGSIGTWTQISNAFAGAVYSQSAIAGNKIYYIGGYSGSNYLNAVYVASFTSGITDYTPYYTAQSNTSSTFNLPNYYVYTLPGENYYIKY